MTYAGPPYREEDHGYSTPCWIWQLSCTRAGYAQRWCGDTMRRMHIVFYEERYGRVPDGLELDHLCGIRACVNPDHLEPVTHRENLRRGRGAKLTAEQRAMIRRIGSAVASRVLAESFRVDHKTVLAVRAGLSWQGD